MAKSSSEQLAKLAKAPPGVKLGILGGVVVLLGLAYYFLRYSELDTERTAQRAQRTNLAAQEKQLQERKREYVKLLQEKQALEEEIARNAVKLPAAAELPAFFVHLQSQALAANVDVVRWTRQPEMPVDTYVKVPVSMTVTGTFYQLLQYFKLLHDTPRIITVENLRISTGKFENDQLLLSATFLASTFRQADQPAPTGAP